MLSNVHQVIRPSSVVEAVERLRDGGGAIRAMAGGTATALFKSREISTILDLWGLPLRYVTSDAGGLHIGATSTLGNLDRSADVRALAGGALWEAARSAASTPLRNLITAGGNLAGLYPWSDLPPALLALGARVVIAGEAGPELSVEELVENHPSRVLGPASLIREIVVPTPRPGTGSAFLKFGVSAVDYAWLDVATAVEMDGGVCRACRFAIGAIEPRCRRLSEVESMVEGEEIDERLVRAAGEAAAQAVKPLGDPRASEDYRLGLLRTLSARVLLLARDRAVGGGS